MRELSCVSYGENESVFEKSGNDSKRYPRADEHSCGQEFEIFEKGDVLILVPGRPVRALRGFVRGIPMTGFREKKIASDRQ